MIELRIHGRGGQGAVVASKVLAEALFLEGNWVQAFPSFGVERRGAPVTAFARIDDKPILIRSQIYRPQYLIVIDPTLISAVDVTGGLVPGGFILINSEDPPEAYERLGRFQIATVDANAIAIEHQLGTTEQPIVNTAILGAFSRATGLVRLDSVIEAIRLSFPSRPEANIEAARAAYERVRVGAAVASAAAR